MTVRSKQVQAVQTVAERSQAVVPARREAAATYDSADRRSAPLDELRAAWRYRELIVQLIARDIKVRYKRSVLGVAWTMINPLAMMLVLSIVFSHMFRINLPHYSVYVLSALLLWNLFSQTTTAAMTQLVWGGPLLNRIYVPRTLFALSAVGTGMVNLVLSMIPLLLLMVATKVPLRPVLFWLPIPMILTGLFALGVALLLSILAVSFPDVVEMWQIALSAWYFLTPIMYPKTILPASYLPLLNLNPMYHLVEAFRAPVYAGWPAGPHTLLAAAVSAVLVLAVGWFVFSRKADDIVYRV